MLFQAYCTYSGSFLTAFNYSTGYVQCVALCKAEDKFIQDWKSFNCFKKHIPIIFRCTIY